MTELFVLILVVIPVWLMAVLMSAVSWVCWRRFRRRGNRAILAVFFPLVVSAVFYWWGVLFDPEPLLWIGGGRVSVFGLGLGILLWLRATEHDE